MKFCGEIADPVHKYIAFSNLEKDIIDTDIFQRLRRIRQLAGAHLVYPGAQHSRFEHSLGTMHIAGHAGNTLYSKGYIDGEEEIQKLRTAALLHDIGHGPFSHLFEEVLESKRTCHEDIGKRIIQETEIADILRKYGYEPIEISKLSVGQHNIIFLNEVISGGLSADLMDYLPRDSIFTGVEYGKLDHHRLIASFEVIEGHLAINRSALYSFESMLISRYEMFKAVYFHKTVRSAEIMLLHTLLLSNDQFDFTNVDLCEYIKLTDEYVLEKIIAEAENKKAIQLASDYRSRKLLKCVYERLLHKRDKFYKKLDKKLLKELEILIAEEAGIAENTVFIDASRAPSMPLTPTKKEISSIILIDRDQAFETPVSEIPLIDSITGFLDMLRIYTAEQNRNSVEQSIRKVLVSKYTEERISHG